MEKNKYHILVVDDDDKIKELIKQFLVEKGLIVSTASNPVPSLSLRSIIA